MSILFNNNYSPLYAGGSNSRYTITYPLSLTNQSISVTTNTPYERVSDSTNSYLDIFVPTINVTVTPSFGYIAGSIIIDGVDTNQTSITEYSLTKDITITCNEAIIKEDTSYLFDDDVVITSQEGSIFIAQTPDSTRGMYLSYLSYYSSWTLVTDTQYRLTLSFTYNNVTYTQTATPSNNYITLNSSITDLLNSALGQAVRIKIALNS